LVGAESQPYVPLRDAHLPEARPDGLVAEESTSPPVAVEVMVGVSRVGSGCCLILSIWSDQCVSAIDLYIHLEIFGLLSGNCVYGFCID
jgi:hypothetical protein